MNSKSKSNVIGRKLQQIPRKTVENKDKLIRLIINNILLSGPRSLRRHPTSTVRRRSEVLAAQAFATRFPVISIARPTKPKSQPYDSRRRGRYICRREEHAIEKRRRSRVARHSAADTNDGAGIQIQFGVFRQVLPSRDVRGEFGGRYDSRERRQVSWNKT